MLASPRVSVARHVVNRSSMVGWSTAWRGPPTRSGDVDPPVLVSRASLTCAVDLTTGLGVRSGADPAARRPRRSAALLDLSTLAMALPDAAQGRSPVLVGVSRSRSRSRSP
jgi:hypothetical protein